MPTPSLFYDELRRVIAERAAAQKSMPKCGDPIGQALRIDRTPAPVRVVECPYCKGDGWREVGSLRDDLTAAISRCTYCAGRGRIATDGGEA